MPNNSDTGCGPSGNHNGSEMSDNQQPHTPDGSMSGTSNSSTGVISNSTVQSS